jgi:phosphoribosylformimino-5-aminoimidazole carboxamide ribotide isomerase
MELMAAIDLMDGAAVRLVRGEFDRRRDFGDPLALARDFLAAGVPWLHVVDLDAARTGVASNRGVVLAIAEVAHERGARVQVGGGLRTGEDVDALVAAGVDRVVLGTAVVEEPSLVDACARRHPGRVAAALDYRRREDGTFEPATRGWAEGTGASVSAALEAFLECQLGAVVVTSIDRDGTLQGPDVHGLAEVLDATPVPVVASGGVGRPGDLRRLASLRSSREGRALAGVVVGRALADGTMRVEEAMAACAP